MKYSATQRILNHLKCGKKLTALTALNKFGCLRLGARIHELRQAGYEILAKSKVVGKKRVAEYWMP